MQTFVEATAAPSTTPTTPSPTGKPDDSHTAHTYKSNGFLSVIVIAIDFAGTPTAVPSTAPPTAPPTAVLTAMPTEGQPGLVFFLIDALPETMSPEDVKRFGIFVAMHLKITWEGVTASLLSGSAIISVQIAGGELAGNALALQ